MNELLPLGTILKPKKESREYMIIGYYPLNQETNKLYDYATCLYPYGIAEKKLFLINNSDIEEIHFYGEQSPKLAKFRKELIDIKNLRLSGRTDDEIINYLETKRNERK